MSPVVWLIPVVVVAVVAAAVTAWLARPKKPLGMFDSVEAHDEFVAALAASCRPQERQAGKRSKGGIGPLG